MAFPETEVLTNLVRRVFRIDDVTLGDARSFIVRYRGQLLSEDSAAAYDQLAESLKPHGIVPLFRKQDGAQVILLAPTPPPPRSARPWINVVLFVLTVFSVMLAQAQPSGPMPADTLGQITALLSNILSGWPFAVSLLGILLAHEFGHYLMSRHHRTPATLPYFIPLPFSALGTLGAAIVMQGTPKNTRVLFDIGVAGPLAGLIVAIPVLWIGLSLSALGPVEDVLYPAVQAGQSTYCPNPKFQEDGRYSCPQDNSLEGNSAVYLGMKFLRFGELLPAPPDYNGQSPILYWIRYFFTGQPIPEGGRDVFIDPVAFAGWAGLLVTALNLLPAGTLDGGHVVYSLFGEKASKAFPFILLFLVLFGFFWMGWWIWAALMLWLGRVHAQPLDQITRLDAGRKAVAILVLVIFVLVFAPVPFVTF
jgi:membrane-associated protease RseP (regulator of RpoE activity)